MVDTAPLLDATPIDLSSLRSGWADMVKGHRAVKLDVGYDPYADAPLAAKIIGQKTNDITQAKAS